MWRGRLRNSTGAYSEAPGPLARRRFPPRPDAAGSPRRLHVRVSPHAERAHARARPRAHAREPARAFAEGPGSEAPAWAWVAQVGLGRTGAPEKREVDFPRLEKEEREKERRVRERERKKQERGATAGPQLGSEIGAFPW